MKKLIYIFLVFFISLQLKAQSFSWYSGVEKVEETAFYNIYLNPDITSKLKYELPDIRLFDDKNNEIPFILRLDRKNRYSTKLKKMEILKDSYKLRKGVRNVIVQNLRKETITNFKLNFRETDAIIKIKVLGSYDKKNWYILKNTTNFHTELKNKQVELFVEDVPENEFNYFNFEISTSKREKVELKSVQYRQMLYSNRNYMQLISPNFTQDNTTIIGKSIIQITFKQPEFIDKLRFTFNENDYFLRKANLLKVDTVGEKKLNLQQYDRKKRELVFSSATNNEFEFTNFKAQQLELKIDNLDDAPLNLISVRAYQLNAYLIAHLEKGKEYTLRFGNDNLAEPLYDLNYFTDSIPLALNIVEAGKVLPYLTDENLKTKFKMPVYFLWFLIFIISAFLVFMVFRMFKIIK